MNAFKFKETGSDIFFSIIFKIMLALIVCIQLYPLIFTISASISDPKNIVDGKIYLFPKGFTLDSYKVLFSRNDIWIGFKNSVTHTLLTILISISMTLLAAFPLSRNNLKGRGVIMKIMIFTMYFQGGMIPSYLVIKELGLVNNMWSVILLGSFSVYNMIVTITFLKNTIPEELYESAYVDGCSNTRMLLKIVIPLSKPIIAVLVLFYGVAQWNQFFLSLLYLTKPDLKSLQLVLRQILFMASSASTSTDTENTFIRIMAAEQLKYSSIIVTSIPMFLLYPFAQKYFVKGVMVGSIKG